MRRVLLALLTAALGSAALGSAALAAEPLRPRDGSLKLGDAAPDFELRQLKSDKPVKLADLRGKPVVLVFGSCT